MAAKTSKDNDNYNYPNNPFTPTTKKTTTTTIKTHDMVLEFYRRIL
jgi:hypothetical protein